MSTPNAVTSFAVANKAIPQFFAGAISNKAAVLLTWTDTNSGAAETRIETSPNNTTWTLAAVASPGATSIQIGNLPLGASSFYLRATARNGSDNSTAATLTISTPSLATSGNPPTSPSGLTVSSVTGYSAQLAWTDNSDNESAFIIVVSIDIPNGAVRQVTVPAMTTGYLLDLTTIFGSSDTVASTDYRVTVHAQGGRAAASAAPPYSSAESNSVSFHTLAAQIRITSALTRTIERGVALGYEITTNTAATSYTATPLPTGLSLTDGNINGTITAVPGTYAVTISATDGTTTDTRVLTLFVTASTLNIVSAQTVNAILDVAFQFILTWQRSGGGSGAVTWSVTDLPGWLTLNSSTGHLSGTPVSPGVYAMTVNASDGTRLASAPLIITVPALTITSSPTITAFTGEFFSDVLTASSAGATWTLADGAPDWLSLDPDTGTLTGTAPTAGVFNADVTAQVPDGADSQTLTITVGPVLSAPATISGWKGDQMIQIASYLGNSTPAGWFLTNAPAGLTQGTLGITGTYGGTPPQNLIALYGAPTTPGIFDATLAVQVNAGGVPVLISTPIRFLVGGDLFLPWLHDDPQRRVLQVSIFGQRAIQDFALDSSGLILKQGDDECIYIVFRDGLFGSDGGGRELISDGFTLLEFYIRPKDDYDGDPLIQIIAAPVTESVNGHTVFKFVFRVESNAINEEFAELDTAAGSDASEQSIDGMLEIRWTRNARSFRSQILAAKILQDVAR